MCHGAQDVVAGFTENHNEKHEPRERMGACSVLLASEKLYVYGVPFAG